MTHLPLDDVRVVDLTVARAGPACVRQLADWGADVVRVEHAGPGVLGHRHGSDPQNLHRNVRSLSLDLRSPGALDVLHRLVDRADVVVENMRPSVKHRRGFDYEALRARNPRLVYGSISGFGQDGPYAERGGLDQVAQGMGGLMSVTGEPGGTPLRVGIPISDLTAGLYLAIGILVALHDRERTGEGRWVQTSLLESMVAMLDFQATRWTMDHTVPESEGNHHPTLVPMGCFATLDGHVNVGAPGGRLLERFYEAVGLPELAADERFTSFDGRAAHREELNAAVGARLASATTAHWVEAFNEVGVPCGPVYRLDEVFADPQVEHLGLVASVEHPALGPIDLIRNPVSIGDVRTVRAPAPDAGQDSDAVLAELGFDADAVARLRAEGIVP
ncbi:MAG: CoA transferase [Actinomycetia bacterium]|nr:CoA transferase [Actinomycetes bacterium]